LDPRKLPFNAEGCCAASVKGLWRLLPREIPGNKVMSRLAFSSLDPNQVLESWAYIINQYGTRRLTVETDVFPALSGLVKTFLDRGLGDFVAGVWADNLPLWLTWKSSAQTTARNKYVCSVMAVGSRLKAISDIAY
jgi:hypothetical protein